MNTFTQLTLSSLLLVATLLLSSCGREPSQTTTQYPALATKAAPLEYKTLLTTYVSPKGVDYQRWSQSPLDLARLQSVTDFYATTHPPIDQQQSLAWHLNAYNAWILQQILTNWPSKGPLDTSLLFFHRKSITISGRKMSLQHLEQQIIRPTFNEPRIHFALNCASRSCPPLHPRPFQAQSLDSTLSELTRVFINTNPHALSLSGKNLQLSKIFDWYQKDFGSRQNLIPFINRYRKVQIPSDSKISFTKYDWALNQS